jgi:hypothetical protein
MFIRLLASYAGQGGTQTAGGAGGFLVSGGVTYYGTPGTFGAGGNSITVNGDAGGGGGGKHWHNIPMFIVGHFV